MLIDEALHILNIERPRRPKNKIDCPHHADKTPSLHLYEDDWYCYSCGANGDAFGLIAALTGEPIEDVLAEYGDGGGKRRQAVSDAQQRRELFNSYYEWQATVTDKLHDALDDLPRKERSNRIAEVMHPADLKKAELASRDATPQEVEAGLREATAYLKDRLEVQQQLREMRENDGAVGQAANDAVSRSEILRPLSQARGSSRSRLRGGRTPRNLGRVRVAEAQGVDGGDVRRDQTSPRLLHGSWLSS